MYQVIRMYGDNEPWWFFEGWQSDITEQHVFETFEAAEDFYKHELLTVSKGFTKMNAKPNYLCAFWNEGEERWCEECDDSLQQYRGIALLEDFQPVNKESGEELYEAANSSGKAKCCKRFKQGIGR